MCGIAGIFSYRKPVEPEVLERMNEQLIHRGPDADGFYVSPPHGPGPYAGLAMRRLKVIDLETGNQPIHDGQEKFWIVFNGEIYNYRQLRAGLEKKGHRFYTRSDTEVILHQYLEEGEDCVNSLIGMFAFAIYNTQDLSVFIARDRLGIKPLFYHEGPEGVVFASENKALFKHPQVGRELNLQAVSHYFSLGYLPSEWTPWKGIRQLPAGHFMKIKDGRIELKEYWDVPLGEAIDVSEKEALREIERLLHQSMERRLIADVPIGAFLSGGLDSTALIWLMKEHRHEKIKTFSVGFDHSTYDETPYAREAAKYFGTDHSEFTCKAENVLHYISNIAFHADNLLGDQAALPLYMVSAWARTNGVTVCLSGDGGDEIFVGYPTFHADRYHRIYSKIPAGVRRWLIKPLVHALPASVNKLSFDYKARKFIQAGDFEPDKAHYWWRTIFSDDEKRSLFSAEALTLIGTLDAYPLYGEYFEKADALDPVNKSLYADMKVWLAGNNLYKVDTMSMAHGLEARVPFLDHELVEYMAKLPASLKFRGNRLKYLMKKLLKGKIPDNILNRPKAGFHSPVPYWFRHALKEPLKKIFSEPHSGFDRLFNRSHIGVMLADHAGGRRNHAYQLWALLVFKHWLNCFGAD